jgi:hypothetical protein
MGEERKPISEGGELVIDEGNPTPEVLEFDAVFVQATPGTHKFEAQVPLGELQHVRRMVVYIPKSVMKVPAKKVHVKYSWMY